MNPTRITVIGGGLGGLTVATLLARGGRSVTLYEKSLLGGRAGTTAQHGALFNHGPHALYAAGRAMQVLTGLGIEPQGRAPPTSGGLAFYQGQLHALPVGAVSLLTTSLLGLPEKLELGRLLAGLGTLRPAGTLREWLARSVRHPKVADVIRATVRVATYTNNDDLPAALAFDQVRLAVTGNVIYLDGGWQTLVEALRAKAIAAGVRIVEHHKVTRLEGETVLAVTPQAARALVPSLDLSRLVPVRAACLDLALSALPRPRHFFALGVDQPLYFSLHSKTAQLGPHHVIHAAKYLAPADDGAAALGELEALVDAMQPGWRDHVVTKRFLPDMTVVNALAGHRVPVDAALGVWLVGDWVGEESMLADCTMASASEVARRILGLEARAAAA